MIKKIILILSIVIASGLLLTNIYTSIVDATSWGSNFPGSIETARKYFAVVNPGNFFRLFSPLNQLIALIALIVFWKTTPASRKFLGTALAIYVLTDMFTFGFFYPRNDIMFVDPITDIEKVKQAWSQWNSMNWVRSLVIAVGIVCSFIGLDRVYQK